MIDFLSFVWAIASSVALGMKSYDVYNHFTKKKAKKMEPIRNIFDTINDTSSASFRETDLDVRLKTFGTEQQCIDIVGKVEQELKLRGFDVKVVVVNTRVVDS